MGIRKLPFGYRMEAGAVVLHPQEANVVKDIFRAYLDGMTYKALVTQLNASEIPYYTGKPWNINMVDRILKETRYTGEQGFPAMIDKKTLNAVSRIRSEKAWPIAKTEAQKVLRRILGRRVPAGTEQSVMAMLNQLIRDPDRIHCPSSVYCDPADIERLRRELDEQINSPEMDEPAAIKIAAEIAAAQFACVGGGEYETERLRRILVRADPMDALDGVLLQNTVSSVRISAGGAISLVLKNGQIYKGDDPA